MDLHHIQAYLRPRTLEEVRDWQSGYTWLAGGTWLFSEPQPETTIPVDLELLGWSELEVTSGGLEIGAACVMSRLLTLNYPNHWHGMAGLQQAVRELASVKVQNAATVVGNLCLAIPAGTFAPVMVALDARYEIRTRVGFTTTVPALGFQTGARQTILQPGDVVRRVWIAGANLGWHVSYQRFCMAAAGLALAIVVAAYHPPTQHLRFALGACVAAPCLLAFTGVPSLEAMTAALDTEIGDRFLEDGMASARYRRHLTLVMMQRSLAELGLPLP